MDIHVNDELVMKKPHPCGSSRFRVTRVGMDFKILCTRCGREVMLPRKKVEHNIKQVYRDGERVRSEELGVLENASRFDS